MRAICFICGRASYYGYWLNLCVRCHRRLLVLMGLVLVIGSILGYGARKWL